MIVPTYPDLAGKVALITGATGDLGAETCRWLGANGAQVIASGRNRERLAELARQMRADGSTVLPYPAELTDPDSVAELIETGREGLGPIDLLFAFAGAGGGRPDPIERSSLDGWREALEANLTATFLTVKAVLGEMKARGRGAIVTMASSAGRAPSQAAPGYGAAKAGIVQFTQDVAMEAGPHGVRANCIAPSSILTARTAAIMPEETRKAVAAAHPLRRLGTTADVAATALFLVSDGAGWITGQTIDLAGGRIMC